MGEHYDHFTLEERCTIARLHEGGQSIRQIAAALDRSPSSVSRELKRNRGVEIGYRPSHAQERAKARRWKGCRLERDAELRHRVLGCLERGWSPEQVAHERIAVEAADRQHRGLEAVEQIAAKSTERMADGGGAATCHYLSRAIRGQP